MSTRQPNILFIMSDDHAAHAIGAYGSRINATPHLDRLATGGMRMDNCFCTNSICTPSRAAILTGTYNHVNRVTTLQTHMDNGLQTFPKILRAAGYQTAMVGKWHLGQGPRHWPAGFDYWNILPGQGRYHDPQMIEMEQSRTLPGYTTDLITNSCLDFLRGRDRGRPFLVMCHHKAPHRPWEPDAAHADMYADEEIPYPPTLFDDYANRSSAVAAAEMRIDRHFLERDLKVKAAGDMQSGPWVARSPGQQDWLGVPADLASYRLTPDGGQPLSFDSLEDLTRWKYQRYIKDYLRCVASIDDNVGRLLNYLDEDGIAEDTVVIYTSDQGFFLGDHGWYDKRFMYEESLRMPMLVRYPREIPDGATSDAMVLNVDFAQTLLDLAGCPIPRDMQGSSMRPVLQGTTPADWRRSMYYRYWMHGGLHNVWAHYGVRTHRHKLIYYYADPLGAQGAVGPAHPPEWELFDLEKDPYELNSVYADPAYQEVAVDLKNELARLQREVGDTAFTG